MPDKDKIVILVSDRDTDPALYGVEIKSESSSFTIGLDTVAAGWSAIMPWQPGIDSEIDRLTRNFSFSESIIYVGGEQVSKGRLYTTEPIRLSTGRRQKNLFFYSYTVDMIDCVWNKPFQYFNHSYLEIAEVQALGYDILMSLDPSAELEATRILGKVEANITDNMYDRLSTIAKEQGLLLSSDKDGGMLITKFQTDKNPVGTIRESTDFLSGSTNSTEFKSTFDGRKLFARYSAIKSDRNMFQEFATIFNDKYVPGRRTQRFEANSNARGTLKESAKWAASKGVADALTITFPVQGWHSPEKKLWKQGDIVTVISETLSLNKIDMLVRSIKFKFDSTNGKHSELSLVPPEVYSGEEIPLNIFSL